MIHKFISITNVGNFVNVSFKFPQWNGILEKYNAFYADNGSGKTTLTQIFKSTQDAKFAQELQKKKTLDSTSGISVVYMNENHQKCNYQNAKWNNYDKKIDIFDSYYIEDNVYIITLGNYQDPGSYYEVVVGDNAIKTYKEIVALVVKRKKETTRRRNWKSSLKELVDEQSISAIKVKIKSSQKLSFEIAKKIATLEEKQVKEAEEFGMKYLSKINFYLTKLGTQLQITKLNKVSSRFVYYVSIAGHELRSDSRTVSLKHTLSEGEKNCLAFAFFLARLDLRSDIADRAIIFDDPISSLDSNRRNITLNLLTRFAKSCKQFILLSHDMKFINDFKAKIGEAQVLKIVKSQESSQILLFDIKRASLTGIFKDILVLREFAEKGELSNHDPRDVVRCLRPVLEGFIRLKYYMHLATGEWLGDFIKKIRNANEGDVFYPQKSNLLDIEDINDYSKTYHHSNPNYMEEPIITSELRSYCNLIFEVIERI